MDNNILDDEEVYLCPECDGRGYKDDTTCHICNGIGILNTSYQKDCDDLPSSD